MTLHLNSQAELEQAIHALVARDPLLWALFAALWICTLVPLWVPRFLPLLDLPNHLDAIAIWHRYGHPDWGYSKYYDLNLIPLPYWGYFFPVQSLIPMEIELCVMHGLC